MSEAEKSCLLGQQKVLAVAKGVERFPFFLYGEIVYLYNDHHALEHLIKRNQAHQQYRTRQTRWLNRLAHFGLSKQYTIGTKLKITDCLSRHPTENESFKEKYEDEYVINNGTEFFNIKHKDGQLLNLN